MKKKLLAAGMAGAMVLGVLAGCGGGSSSTATTGPPAAARLPRRRVRSTT